MIVALKILSMRIRERMAYRVEFFISLLAMFITELLPLFITLIIYANTTGFEGWTLHDIILLQGTFLLVKGFAFAFFMGIIWNSNNKVRKGDFDQILLKPKPVLLMFIYDSFDTEDIAKFIGGLGLIIYAFWHLGISSPLSLMLYMLGILLGIIFFLGVALYVSAYIFSFVESWSVYNLITAIGMMAQYPSSIYPKFIVGFFSTAIPVFAVVTLPLGLYQYIFSTYFLFLIINTFIFTGIALWIWHYVIARYTSSGG
ncbi:MAG: ABC transporter permease [Candidatus Woesearchaeota archaeon]